MPESDTVVRTTVFGFKEQPRHFFSDPGGDPPGFPRFDAPRPERPRDPANPGFRQLRTARICSSVMNGGRKPE